MKFDQRSLTAIKPDGKSQLNIADPNTPGLWLKVTSKGAKTYYFVYRIGGRGSKVRWLKVGSFSSLPLASAREQARAYRVQVDSGIDPAAERKARAARMITVAEAASRFMAEYATVNMTPRGINNYRYLFSTKIAHGLGNLPIRDLTRDDVSRWHSRIGKDGVVSANRALTMLSSICTQAEIWGLRQEGANPCRHVKRFPESARIRDITTSELKVIGEALQFFESAHLANPFILAAIKVIALCAGRVSEVVGLRYDGDLNLDEGYALLREHKTSKRHGARYLEFPPEAVEIISALPRAKDSDYVFPSLDGKPFSATWVSKVFAMVCREAGIDNLHLHDFRSFAASEGLEQGIDARVTAKLLGHASSQTTEKHYLKVRKRKTAEAAVSISRPIAKAFGLESNLIEK